MKKDINVLPFLIIFMLIAVSACNSNDRSNDNEANSEKLIRNLISRMTLEEKVGQMTMICISNISANGDKTLIIQHDSAVKAIVQNNVGSFVSGSGTMYQWKDFVTGLQEIAMTQSRNKIPLLIGIDHVHGANYITEGTIFPHNLTLSCSFDTSVTRACAMITASETLEAGIRWNLAPVLDIGRNVYWPRLYETFGEDPLVCATFGSAYISGLQTGKNGMKSGLAACGKHFIGYSDPKSGWDRAPAEIPEQVLYEFFVPPFREAIASGVSSIMLNSGEVNGIPVHADPELVNGMLKYHLGFRGVVISDIKDIQKLADMHRYVLDEKEATLLAIQAGLDISMACNSYDFIRYTLELVKEGKISEKRINQSVKKILRLKASLGLFDNPYPAENSTREEDRRDHLNMAQIAAEGSMVLLKNEGILPLDKSISRIAVTGFAVNSRSCMNGGWTFDWAGAPEDRQPEDMLTIPEALKQDFPLSHIYEVALSQENNPETDRLIKNADVIILTAGEMPYSEFRGNINDLTLDKIQDDWIRKIFSFNKPVILVLIEGRPRLITDYVNQAEAIIFAGLPGMKGAEALSGILCGRINPSGHLSFSYPLSPGHAVPYYQKYTDASTDLFPFGHGLSYTSFIYSDLHVTDTVIHSPTDTLIATIKISNCGNREGQDVILWFLSYPPGKFTRPQKILRQFNKVSLKSGETTEVSFKIIPAVHFSYPDETGKIILQKGDYHLTCADQSVAIHYLK